MLTKINAVMTSKVKIERNRSIEKNTEDPRKLNILMKQWDRIRICSERG